MLCIWYFTLLLALEIGRIKAQTGGTTSNGDTYVCVPPGYCDNGGSPPSPGIDPRIVTPGQLCPSGMIPCYTQGPSSKCGQLFVTQTNTADGAADVGAYPWQAYLDNGTFAGSGVLLDNYHVLTAAHKVAGNVANPGNLVVLMGVNNPNDATNVQASAAASITLHPQFNPSTLVNDIAIVRVSSPFALSSNYINTACLPAADASFIGSTGCVVAGWGQTSFTNNDAPTNPMKQVYVNVVDYNTCRASFSSILLNNVDVYLDTNNREICAGGEAMKDACTQDGGAPLMCPGTGKGSIAGLVIWGKGCGQANVYGVYVGVPAYRGWIDTTITALNNS